MNHIIRLLPDAIANQIAAGEVVQRPASVVKELLENAIDAGATEILLRVKEGGKTFIQVVDNGKGMSELDARMCFERHATSKIRQFEDMQKLATYGFRGEALASIAAVSQLELKTRQPSEETGTLIRIEGSELKAQESVAMEPGSSFTIRNLFYNVPARRNFLKSNQVEFAHISEEFYRVALSYPNVSFSFYQGDTLLIKTSSSHLSKRVSAVFGDSYRENLLAVSEETDFLKVNGYIGKPEISRKTRGEQYFFANNRFIKNGYLHHAVASAFEGLLPQASFPFYILFLEISPEKIDINVHPTKTEIKFENERFVYSIVQAAVRKALQQSMLVPAIDFEPVSPWLTQLTNQPVNEKPVFTKEVNPPSSGYTNPYQTHKSTRPDPNWEKLFSASGRSNATYVSAFETKGQNDTVRFEATSETTESRPVSEKPKPMNLHGQYLLYQVKSGLMMIHMARAWERISYERLILNLENGSSATQQLLFPVTLHFSDGDFALIEEMGEEIRTLGIDWSAFGGNSILVSGLPADLSRQEPGRLFQEFLEQYRWNQGQLKIPKKQSIARALAKRSSTQQEFHFWKEPELLDLVNRLFACQVPDLSPDGSQISKIVSLEEIAARF